MLEVLSLRTQGIYARSRKFLEKELEIKSTHFEDAEQVAALVRLYASESILLGYVPATKSSLDTLALIDAWRVEPVLRAMPVVLLVAEIFAVAVGEQLRGRETILPVGPEDLMSPYLPGFVRAHTARTREQMRDREPGWFDQDTGSLPWEEYILPP